MSFEESTTESHERHRRRWLLCWYAYLDESRCTVEMREVLLV